MTKKIGIFAGSFDPVHAGHIRFALQAVDKFELDEVYFLPELKPRFKPDVSHISHRLAMLEIATKPYRQLKILELPDKQFKVKTILPKLAKKFNNQILYYLIGSDEAKRIPDWPDADILLRKMKLIVARRAGSKLEEQDLKQADINMLRPKEPKVSSSQIREAARKGKTVKGSLESVNKYIEENWLYRVIPE